VTVAVDNEKSKVTWMKVAERSDPPHPEFRRFYYWDSFEAPLSRTDLGVDQIYLGIFAHHPWWAKWLLLARTRIVSVFGLKGPTAADFNHAETKAANAVGDKIARFTLFSLSEDEIVTGGNDKHLDFRVLVSRVREDGVDKVVLSTVVSPHNFFGKAYLFLILPFHKFGIKTIMSNAVAAGRV
jgi:Protein of unknown function (DUF2867)